MLLRFERQPEAEEPVVELDDFGIAVGRYKVKSHVVRPNQTLSQILTDIPLAPETVQAVTEEMQLHFDPRRIRSGQPFHAYVSSDSTQRLQYFVYEISMIDFLKVIFGDSLTVEKGQKELTTVSRISSGIIDTSLWNTLSENNLSFELAIRLSEILAWEVDFHRIQQGDLFKVIYYESFVGDKSVDVPRVEAVYFRHHGREIFGFYFESDTVKGFFDKEGDNLRKIFLRAPLEFVRITSRFSHSRLHPVLRHRRAHHGTDYAAPYGTPILAVGDGTVTRTGFNSGNGNYVRIRHNSVYETQYLHMSRFAAGIRPGTRVTQGQVIGYVGSTGLATGPHVCFRFFKNGTPVNHLNLEFPSADPLPDAYREQFIVIRDRLLRELGQIPYSEKSPATWF
ncbi:MAG TPA: peptidoglycan DD-metalloendopeptidase family protein [Bacteroidales bacterium]|nr:peptidoglycan DD-metalloendopeptidase family protein [Bacteroidales bacterium]